MVLLEPLVGRDEELAALRSRLSDAKAGRGRLVLITGAAGMGKTRLVEELVAGARIPYGWGEAADDEGSPPLWPWARALRSLPGPRDALAAATDRPGGPSAASASDAAAAEFVAHRAVLDALESVAEAGLLLVLEDLHWADEASVRLLDRLATSVRRTSLLVVGTHRGTTDTALGRALPQLLARPGTEMLRLTALPAAAARSLVAQTVPDCDPSAVDAVAVEAGGNPLYLRTVAHVAPDLLRGGTIASALGALPELRDLVVAALRGIGSDSTIVVQTLSVLGAEADVEVLAETIGYDSTAELLDRLVPAERAGLLDVIELDRVRMAHALVRDAIYAALDPQQRQVLHRRAAEVLGRRAERGSDHLAGEIAGHLRRAGERRLAAQWAVRAAGLATRAGAHAAAAEQLREAIEAQPPDVGLILDHARAAYLSGDLAAALESCRRVANDPRYAGDHTAAGRAAIILQGVADPVLLREVEALCRQALHALDAVGPQAEPGLRAQVYAQLAAVTRERGDHPAAVDWAAAALVEATRSDDRNAELDAVLARGPLTHVPHLRAERMSLGARAVELGRSTGRPLAELWGHTWRADGFLEAVDIASAQAELAELQALAKRTRLPLITWHLYRHQASGAALVGDYARGHDLSMAANDVADELGDISARALHLGYEVYVAWVRGVAPDLSAEDIEAFRHGPPLPVAIACRAVYALLQGRTEEARALYRVLPIIDFDPENPIHLPMLAHAIDLATEFGDEPACRRLGDVLEVLHRSSPVLGGGSVHYLASLARVRARVESVAGSPDDAVELFEEGLRVDAALGARPYVTIGRIGLAEALFRRDKAGDVRRARDLAARAAADAAGQGLPGPAARAGALFEAIERSTRAADPLTAREREVADLVAAALSNRDIAQRLVVSERTVEGHVRNILAKTGLTSRTEIVRRQLSADG